MKQARWQLTGPNVSLQARTRRHVRIRRSDERRAVRGAVSNKLIHFTVVVIAAKVTSREEARRGRQRLVVGPVAQYGAGELIAAVPEYVIGHTSKATDGAGHLVVPHARLGLEVSVCCGRARVMRERLENVGASKDGEGDAAEDLFKNIGISTLR